jgi:PAS domain S-box-containing protein
MAKKVSSEIVNSRSLRVLIVEDSEDDTLLEIRELKKGGYNPVYERVETATAMKKALQEKQWDIILCDYKLPKFNAPSAIAVLKETNIDIPLLIVSGTIGEETAVECMRLGAQDYIMKDNLSRLCPAIKRELKEAETRVRHKMAEEELRESEDRFRILFEEATDCILLLEILPEGIPIIRDANGASFRLLGYERDEMIGQPVSFINATPAASKIVDERRRNILSGMGAVFQVRHRCKDGTIRDFECSATEIQIGSKTLALSVERDITERKQAEVVLKESENKYRLLADNVNDVIFVLDMNLNYTYVSPSAKILRGYEPAEVLKQTPSETLTPSSWDLAMKTLSESLELEKSGHREIPTSWTLQLEMRRKDGTTVWTEVKFSIIRDENQQPVSILGVTRDITERKRAEEKLQESEKKYRELYDFLPIPVYEMDLEANITSANRAIYKIFRGTEEDLKGGFKVWQILSPEEIDKVAKNMQKLLKGEQIEGTEYNLVRLDGSVFPAIGISSVIYSDGKPVGLRGAIIDITERKQAEESLRRSEEKYRNIIESMQEGYFENDFAGNFTFVNDAECRNLGYPKEELIGMNNRQYQDETNAQKTYQLFKRLFRTGEPIKGLDVEIIRKNGTKGFNEASVSLLRDAEGKPIGFWGISRDVTERKQAEESLRESEERYKALFDRSLDFVYITDFEGRFLDANTAALNRLGYTREDIPSLNFASLFSEDQLLLAFKELQKIRETGIQTGLLELRLRHKDGSEVYVETQGSTILSNGIPVAMQQIARDITERKQAESQREVALEALKKNEEMLRLITENMSDMIRVTNLQGVNLYLSPSHFKSLGYSIEERVGKSSFDIVHPDDIERLIKFFSESLASIQEGLPPSKRISIEYRVRHADGHYIWLETVGDLLRDAQGKPTAIVESSRDISDRKRAEEGLRKSEHLHRIITDNIRDTVSLLDINFRATWINPSVTKTIGFTLDELAQVPLEKQVTPDSMQRMQDLMLENITAENLADKNKELNVTGEFEFYRKNGEIFWDEMNISLVRDTDGKPAGFLTVGRDITERKQAEEERKQSFERMRKALRATVQAISLTVEMKDPYTSGHQQRVADLARAIATEMGLSADRRDFIRTASTIHDIGKIAIPSEILSKPTKLTDLEFSLIKTHPQSGYDILKDIEFPWPVADVVLQHHERMDGSGYPQGLKGNDILLEARILAIADVVEAIASHRPYRAALGIDLALEEISKNKGILYDAAAVDACLKLFREKGYTLVLKK